MIGIHEVEHEKLGLDEKIRLIAIKNCGIASDGGGLTSVKGQDHSILNNLDYASAGHTGFLQDTNDVIKDTHIDWGVNVGQVSTADIPEQTNLYFTDERAQDAVGGMVGNSLQYVDATPLLDTIQDIRITATPQFARLGLGQAADASYVLAVTGDILYYVDADNYTTVIDGRQDYYRDSIINTIIGGKVSTGGVADANYRYLVHPSGRTWWGNGTDAQDVNLSRQAAGVLGTEQTFNYGLGLKCRGTIAAGRATLVATQSSVAVAFDVAQPDTNYSISICPPYQTSFWYTSKAVGGFTINVGTTNAYNQTIDWSIMA